MSRGFYNYDTRGASASSQIITLERLLNECDSKLNDKLNECQDLKQTVIELCNLITTLKWYLTNPEDMSPGVFLNLLNEINNLTSKATVKLYE